MKKALFILLSLLMLSNIACAEKLSDSQLAALKQRATFTETPAPVSLNGVNALIVAQQVVSGFNDGLKENDVYSSMFYYLGVIGMDIKFTNNNDYVAVINWKDSNVSVDGRNYGVPFLSGMKYRDAGNPAATPNTIIPPKGSVTVSALLPSVEFKRMWLYKPAPLLRDKFIKLTYYISITTGGKQDYLTVTSPGIYIHQAYYDQVMATTK